MPADEKLFPFEVVIDGVPVSAQTKSSKSKERWKERIATAARQRQYQTYELGFLDDRPLAVTIYYFSSAPMTGDIDNIVKPILDALTSIAYFDDKVIERVLVQKFEPGKDWELAASTDRLAAALDAARPVVYIRVDDDLSWRSVK